MPTSLPSSAVEEAQKRSIEADWWSLFSPEASESPFQSEEAARLLQTFEWLEVDEVDFRGVSLLLKSVRLRAQGAIDWLLEHGASPWLAAPSGHLPLIEALMQRNEPLAAQLMRHGASPQCLVQAVRALGASNHGVDATMDLLQRLVDLGARWDALERIGSQDHNTVLYKALLDYRSSLADRLLEAGASPWVVGSEAEVNSVALYAQESPEFAATLTKGACRTAYALALQRYLESQRFHRHVDEAAHTWGAMRAMMQAKALQTQLEETPVPAPGARGKPRL